MTKQDKLMKIIEKAESNGFTFKYKDTPPYPSNDIGIVYDNDRSLLSIIFSPEFGKAYWPGEITTFSATLNTNTGETESMTLPMPEWQYHQHQLLTEIQEERDVIEYLYKFI